MPIGIIVKGIGGFYYIKTDDDVYECKARGIFRKNDTVPLPGDRVKISITDDSGKIGVIEEILPRTSQFVRPAVANVNQIAMVLAVKSPTPDFGLLDKLLITAGIKDMKAVICINKIDLDTNGEYKKIVSSYEKTGYEIILLSSVSDSGFDQLRAALQNRITVFAGQSGVGKSTILNKIMDSLVMQTGSISERNSRGKHTTRHAELLELETGGYVVDTPGFSSFELSEVKYDELERYYPEFKSYLGKCKFTRCSHIAEPSCCIKEALALGDIDAQRHSRYAQFYNALKQKKEY